MATANSLKRGHRHIGQGNELPSGQYAKISQFADDTTLILEDTTSLRNATNIVNSFGVLSGLQLNKKKTKALWIGASSKNKIEPLKFHFPYFDIKIIVIVGSCIMGKVSSKKFYGIFWTLEF